MELYSLLLEIAGGGLTGYLTNSLAIKMLFKNYGPFGGVILKTRKQFIQQLSTLVENDLVNARTLEKELAGPGFQKTLEAISTDLLTETLYESCGGRRVRDIPALEKSLQSCLGYYQEKKEYYLEKLFTLILPGLSLEEILTPPQIEYLSAQLLELLIEMVRAGLLEDFLIEFFREKKELTLSTVLPPSLTLTIDDNIRGRLAELPEKLRPLSGEIDNHLETIWKELGLSEFTARLQEELTGKTLEGILGPDLSARLSRGLKDKLLNYIEENPALLERAAAALLQALRESRVPLKQLLPREQVPDLINHFTPFLAELADWLELHRLELGERIDEALELAVNEQRGEGAGWQSRIKRFLYQQFRGDLSGRAVVDQLVSYLKLGLADDLQEELINYLEANNTGSLITALEEKGLLSPEMAAPVIHQQLEKSTLESLFKTDCRRLPLLNLGEKELKALFLSGSRELISSPAAVKLLLSFPGAEAAKENGEENNEVLQGLWERPLKELFTEETLQETGQLAARALDDNRGKLSRRLKKEILKYCRGKRLADFSGYLIEAAGPYSRNILENALLGVKNRRLSLFIDLFNSQEHSGKKLAASLLHFTRNNLASILGGRIRGVISSNLNRISDREMQLVIERFMGSELKPLTLFGALLGLAAGGLLFFIQLMTGIGMGLNLPLSLFIYGLTGYLTNIIAIRMIFRPYRAIKIMGIRLPLTPGVIAREKPRFVRALGEFINRELLNNHRLVQTFREKRPGLEKYTVGRLASDNYRSLKGEIKSRSVSLAAALLVHSDRLIHRFTDWLPQIPGQPSPFRELLLAGFDPVKSLRKYLKKNRQALLTRMTALFRQKISSSSKGNWAGQKTPALIKRKAAAEIDRLLARAARKLKGSGRPDKNPGPGPASNILTGPTVRIPGKAATGAVLKRLPLLLSNDSRSVQLPFPALPGPEKILRQSLSFASGQREWLEKKIFDYSKERLGFWFTAGRLLNIEETIASAAGCLIDNIPEIIADHREELLELLSRSLDRAETGTFPGGSGSKSLDRPVIILSPRGLKLLTEELAEGIDPEALLPPDCPGIDPVNPGKLLEEMGLTPADRQRLSAGKPGLLASCLGEKLEEARRIIPEESAELLIEILAAGGLSSPEIIFARVTDEDLESLSDNLFGEIISSRTLDNLFQKFVPGVEKKLKNRGIGAFIDRKQLARDLFRLRERLFNDPVRKERLLRGLTEIIQELAPAVVEKTDKASLDYLLSMVINGLFAAVEKNLLPLLENIDIQRITENEVNRMDPRQLEEMFHSFAGGYFKKIESYGWSGSLIGLAVEFLKTLL